MGVPRRLAASDPFADAPRDPVFEIGDELGADAEFDEMQGHGGVIADRQAKAKGLTGRPLYSSGSVSKRRG